MLAAGLTNGSDMSASSCPTHPAQVARRQVVRAWRVTLRCFLLLILALSGFAVAQASDLDHVPPTSIGPGSQFTVADFDGDRQPDSASIAPGAASSGADGNSRYSIRLQLSQNGPQSFQFSAPSGGLVIEARDVNGDSNVDLVLATAWLRQPVAVFLNDGHGAFSRAAAGSFRGAFSTPGTNLSSTPAAAEAAVGVPPQAPGIEAEKAGIPHARAPADYVAQTSTSFLINPLLLSQPGRAPPCSPASA